MDDAQAVAIIAAIRLEAFRVRELLVDLGDTVEHAADPSYRRYASDTPTLTFDQAITDARDLLSTVRGMIPR